MLRACKWTPSWPSARMQLLDLRAPASCSGRCQWRPGAGLLRTGYRDHISVNARRIEGIDVFALPIGRSDGHNLMPPGPERDPGQEQCWPVLLTGRTDGNPNTSSSFRTR